MGTVWLIGFILMFIAWRIFLRIDTYKYPVNKDRWGDNHMDKSATPVIERLQLPLIAWIGIVVCALIPILNIIGGVIAIIVLLVIINGDLLNTVEVKYRKSKFWIKLLKKY